MNQRQTHAIQEVKSCLNIVDIISQYVKLRRNGSRWVAPCPFHQETKPSFSVTEEGFYYCFGCQASGDIFTFYSQINGLSFRESLEQLAEIAGVKLERFENIDTKIKAEVIDKRQLLKIYAFTSTHFIKNLRCTTAKECQEYLLQRGISEGVIDIFSLGWSSSRWDVLLSSLRRAGFNEKACLDAGVITQSSSGRVYDRFRNRLMFPIKSLSGDIIAFGGRIVKEEKEEAKYINSSESPLYKKGQHLYGLQQARKSISTGKSALITEGYMDVITLHQYGYTNAVGILGTSLTLEQVKRISCFTSNIDILFDGDQAGNKAALRACEMFLAKGLNCKVIVLPKGEDIDSFIRSQGKEAFDQLYAKAYTGIQFCIQSLRSVAPRDAIDWVKNFLKQVEFPELVSRFISVISTGLGFSEGELREYVIQNQTKQKNVHVKNKYTPQPKIVIDKQIMIFLARYPNALKRLEAIGAYAVLKTSWAKNLWKKLVSYSVDEIIHYLTPEEKNFWIQCSSGDVPPQNNEDGEFSAICSMLEAFQLTTQSASVSAALHGKIGVDDFEADLEYLRALQETLERTYGK